MISDEITSLIVDIQDELYAVRLRMNTATDLNNLTAIRRQVRAIARQLTALEGMLKTRQVQ